MRYAIYSGRIQGYQAVSINLNRSGQIPRKTGFVSVLVFPHQQAGKPRAHLISSVLELVADATLIW